MYSGRPGKLTLILEAIASYDLWIWHAFFGTLGGCNDINVLDRSPLFNYVFEGRALPVNYVINDHQYDIGYYLTDSIHLRWAAFILTINLPHNEKESHFAQRQEGVQKDVECAFGVLRARFAIVRQPALARDREMLGKIIIVCIIIHNMIIKDERDSYFLHYDPNDYEEPPHPSSSQQYVQNVNEPFRYETSENRIANIHV
ncbi:protein ALP1-like [Beta vulgaris subsp. vulgaris]|uniref:protein ALP1-like n=1 Tax=Beta vulgaris subsp. vulgaris TaxID=3555 RepID=UPI00053F6EE7|nr:protein ALP1-like [Beta vulgaris subsp. vulgaris]